MLRVSGRQMDLVGFFLPKDIGQRSTLFFQGCFRNHFTTQRACFFVFWPSCPVGVGTSGGQGTGLDARGEASWVSCFILFDLILCRDCSWTDCLGHFVIFFCYGICCKREWKRGIVEDFLSYNYAGDSNIPTLHRFFVLLLVTCSSFVESSDACFFFSNCKTCLCRAVNVQMHGFSVTRCKGCVGRLNGNTGG